MTNNTDIQDLAAKVKDQIDNNGKFSDFYEKISSEYAKKNGHDHKAVKKAMTDEFLNQYGKNPYDYLQETRNIPKEKKTDKEISHPLFDKAMNKKQAMELVHDIAILAATLEANFDPLTDQDRKDLDKFIKDHKEMYAEMNHNQPIEDLAKEDEGRER